MDGVLATMYDARTLHSREVLARLVEAFGDKVFETVIKRTIKFADATGTRTIEAGYIGAAEHVGHAPRLHAQRLHVGGATLAHHRNLHQFRLLPGGEDGGPEQAAQAHERLLVDDAERALRGARAALEKARAERLNLKEQN